MKPVELDASAIRTALFNDGYVVIREVVPKEMCEAVLEAFRTELEIWMGDPASWDRVSIEIDQVPLWGHQSQWDIRQLPEVHRVWTMVWGTQKLWADRNSCRFTPPFRPGRAGPLRLHWDVDPWTRRFSGFRASWRSPTPRSARAGSAVPRGSWPTETAGRPHGRWSSGAPSTGLTGLCIPMM
jgi:hypothetical protein